MGKIYSKICFLIILFLIISPILAQNNTEIVFFYGDGCPYCAKMKSFLNQMKVKYPNITINEYEVYNNQSNQQLFLEYCANHSSRPKGVPTVFINNNVIFGFGPDTAVKIEKIIDPNAIIEEPKPVVPWFILVIIALISLFIGKYFGNLIKQ